VDPAKSAAHADFFSHIDALHLASPIYTAGGNRLPYTMI